MLREQRQLPNNKIINFVTLDEPILDFSVTKVKHGNIFFKTWRLVERASPMRRRRLSTELGESGGYSEQNPRLCDNLRNADDGS